MKKNKKCIFFVITLVALLVVVSTVNATDDNVTDNAISDTPQVATSDAVVTEEVTSSASDNNIVDTKNIEIEEKTLKQDSINIDGINYDIIENKIFEDYSEYSGNKFINNCTLKDIEYVGFFEGQIFLNNSIIDNVYGAVFCPDGNVIINNSRIIQSSIMSDNQIIFLENNSIDFESDFESAGIIGSITYSDVIFNSPKELAGEFTLKNSIINTTLLGKGIGILNLDNVTVTDNGILSNFKAINGNVTSSDMIFNMAKSIEYNCTINNCTINTTLTGNNKGNLTIGENVTYTNNTLFKYFNNIYTDDIQEIIPYLYNLNGTFIFDNITLNHEILNYGNITLRNSKLNSTIRNYGNLTIEDNNVLEENFIIEDYGNIINNNIYQLLPYFSIYNDTYIIENAKITTSKINYGNLTLNNCNITEIITNYGNLVLVNCSLSNNEIITTYNNYNDFITSYKGIFISNNANTTLINCIIENNTFNSTGNYMALKSPIINNGMMNIINTTVNNNIMGYSMVTGDWGEGVTIGNGPIKNNGTLTAENCNFTNNYAGDSGAAITSIKGNVTITNSLFQNNTAGTNGGAIDLTNTTANIINSAFADNHVYLEVRSFNTGGGAIKSIKGSDSNNNISLTVNNCTFTDNSADYDGMGGLISVSGKGGAIYTIAVSTDISHCQFINNSATEHIIMTTYTDGYMSGRSITTSDITNCIFENNTQGLYISEYKNTTIKNNQFKNNHNTTNMININNYDEFDSRYPITTTDITNNTFQDNNPTTETITITKPENATITQNTYSNTTINDTLELNIPEKIYTNEPITITGTYAISNPEYYDADILEQNQFQVYINGELDQTVDTLEFTITPTDSNMILTVQPTISQTRKSTAIQASTLNITLEPITATMGKTAQLTTQITLITDDTEMDVNTGRVYFKVNGKILRDTDTGRILYADVTENTATLDYTVPKTWNEDTTIEAVFTGNDDLPQKTSNIVNPTITTPETSEMEFSVADTTATAGEEVTLTVTTKNLDNGKIVLKVNGKTVKAADGKLYAKVTDETTTFTYTVPKTYKAGEYDIKAVYTSGATKLEAESKLTVE